MNTAPQPPQHNDQTHGMPAIRRAAADALARFMADFQESVQRDDLWSNHPELLEREADQALMVADEMARQIRDFIRYLVDLDS